jgi:two-component system response regulator (stage 0 sporulation protein F)
MKRILSVDDEPHLRLLYELELRRAGYQTMTAANAEQCLEFVETMDPDLILLDIRMPGMDGIEVLDKIIALPKRVPIVIHTAYSSYRDNYLTWAADAYLLKSSNLEELLATVRRLAPLPVRAHTNIKVTGAEHHV